MKRCFGSPDREWLHPENFCNEPIYCEALHSPDEVVYSGSDDEAYDSPTERRIRCENQAQRFLEGKPVFLLSASLRGPFEKESGWVNPWRSRLRSSPRDNPAQRKRPPAPKQPAAVQHESNHIIDSSSCQLRTPQCKAAIPHNADTAQRYMDDESYSRVWNWRDRVVASAHLPTSPIQSALETEPRTADSLLATQQTINPASSIARVQLNDSWSSFTPPETPSTPKRKDGGIPVSSQSDAQQLASSTNPALAMSSAMQPTADLNSEDEVDLSPQAVKIYEEYVLSGRSSSQTTPSPQTSQEVSPERIPVAEAPSVVATTGNEEVTMENTPTPRGIAPGAPSSLGRLVAQDPPSARTDGSFRYRHKGSREKGSSLARSSLSRSSNPVSDAEKNLVLVGETSSKTHSKDGEGPEANVEIEREEPGPAAEGADEEVILELFTLEREGTSDVAPSREPTPSIHNPKSEPAEEDICEDEKSTQSTSQIDGPTLVPASSFDSEHPSMPSLGHFSCEKLSQDVIAETSGFPRRLLWPKSQQRAGGDSLLPSPFGPELTPESRQQEPVGLNTCRSIPPQSPVSKDEIAVVRSPWEEQPVSTIPEDHAAAHGREAQKDAKPTDEHAMENLESQVRNENVQDTEQPQPEAEAESDGQVAAETEMQPASPVSQPKTQSPWVKTDAAPLPPRVRDQDSPGRSQNIDIETKPSQPLTVSQSPWTKQADPVAGTPQQAPSHIHNPILSIVRQPLEQPALQSPWARGDSQIPLPEARFFNPLSSPADSSVLPAISDNTTQSQQALQDEDIDICNSQLYPAHPSTPETKRSGLPTPDFSLSVKSFKDFMTPSPQPAAKRRRISAITAGDHPPSTQALVDAAISNPWARTQTVKPKKRKQKRVSWADQEEPGTPPMNPDTTTTSLYDAEPPRPTPTPQHHSTKPPRTASPPPSILSTAPLPGANEKFAKHFAAVLGNQNRHSTPRTPTYANGIGMVIGRRNRGNVQLLPSASQQVCGSPAVEAMAEAFLRADDVRPVTSGAQAGDVEVEGEGKREGEASVVVGLEMQMEVDREELQEADEEAEAEAKEEEIQEVLGVEVQERGDEEESMQVDDISAVMDNLDDFLGCWDLNVDLAKVRAEREMESRKENYEPGEGMSGLMDVGVWD